ncbi:MAG: polysaccharide biosynthesis protein, partial [Fibrobacteres bacterium]|nr:polysaccharide biosynthesis protein [Fibrobacterota bacterium]
IPMSRIRALAKESLVYGVSSIASRFLNFLLVPFYTHVLTTSDFGVSNIVFAIIAFLNIVYQFGFDAAYLRLSQDEDEEGRKRLFSTAFWSQALASLGFSLPMLALSGPLAHAFLMPDSQRKLFLYAAGILVLDTLKVVPMAHLRRQHAALRFALINLGNVLVNIAANLLFVLYWRKGIEGVFMANLAASAFTLVLVMPVLLANVRAAFQGPIFRQLLRFGLPLVPAGLYGVVNEMAGRIFMRLLSQADIDRLYPGRGYDVQQLSGLFAWAWKLGVFGLLLVQMYRMAWQPFFQQRQKDADAADLFGRILTYLCHFIGFASVTLMVFLDKLVALPVMGRTVIAPAYWPGLVIVPGVLLSYAIQAWVVHFTLGLYIAKRTKYLMWINGAGAVVTLIGNAVLIPLLGLWGATLSAILCYLVIAVMITRKSQQLFPITLAWKRLAPILVWLALGWMFGTAVQMHPDRFSWGMRLGPLLAFWLLPFITGTLPTRELRGALPAFARGPRKDASVP